MRLVLNPSPNCLRTELIAQLDDLEQIAFAFKFTGEPTDIRVLTHSLRVMGALWSRLKAPIPDNVPTLEEGWGEREYEIEQRLVAQFSHLCTQESLAEGGWEDLVEICEALEFIGQADQADWSAYADLTQRCEIPSSIRKVIDNPDREAHAWMEV
jgi:hypothetical protein